jgi:zinc-ribbon domain
MDKTCPKCQTENLTTSKFCKKCGSPLSEVLSLSNSAITYDDKLYEIALEEIESGTVQKGIYARAFSQSEGDKNKTDALYIKFRFQSLKDEQTLKAKHTPVSQPTGEINKVANETTKENQSKIATVPVKDEVSLPIINRRTDAETEERLNEIQRALDDYKKRS